MLARLFDRTHTLFRSAALTRWTSLALETIAGTIVTDDNVDDIVRFLRAVQRLELFNICVPMTGALDRLEGREYVDLMRWRADNGTHFEKPMRIRLYLRVYELDGDLDSLFRAAILTESTDLPRGLELHTKAAAAGSPHALLWLCLGHLGGRYGPICLDTSMRYFRQALEASSEEKDGVAFEHHFSRMDILVRSRPYANDQLGVHLRLAVENGHLQFAYRLGAWYDGQRQYTKAIHWYERSSTEDAYARLGQLYKAGSGCVASLTKALQNFARSTGSRRSAKGIVGQLARDRTECIAVLSTPPFTLDCIDDACETYVRRVGRGSERLMIAADFLASRGRVHGAYKGYRAAANVDDPRGAYEAACIAYEGSRPGTAPDDGLALRLFKQAKAGGFNIAAAYIEEIQARRDEATAEADAQAKAEAEAQPEAEAKARAEAEAEAKARAEAEAEAKAKAKAEAEAEAKAKAKAEAQTEAEAKAEAKAEAEAQAQAEAEAKAKAEAEAKAETDAQAEAEAGAGAEKVCVEEVGAEEVVEAEAVTRKRRRVGSLTYDGDKDDCQPAKRQMVERNRIGRGTD